MNTYLDPHINELVEIYNRLEPGQLLNEMHSILATEQSKLIPELEEYYEQYFDDRQKIAELSAAYREVFDSLKRQQEALVAELDQLALRINNGTGKLNKDIAAYNRDVERFNTRAGSGEMTEAEFEQGRAELEVRQRAINVGTAENDALRARYEQKRRQFDSLAVEFTDLQNSIDSRPAQPEGVQ